jgi:hypothetical protein
VVAPVPALLLPVAARAAAAVSAALSNKARNN